MSIRIRRFDEPDERRRFEKGRSVVGEEPYVSIHLVGAEDYARSER